MIKGSHCKCRAISTLHSVLFLWYLSKTHWYDSLTWAKSHSVFQGSSLSLSHSLAVLALPPLPPPTPVHTLLIRSEEGKCLRETWGSLADWGGRASVRVVFWACEVRWCSQGQLIITVRTSAFCALKDVNLWFWAQTKSPPVRAAAWCVICWCLKLLLLKWDLRGGL